MDGVTVGEHPDMGAETDNQFGAEVTVTRHSGETVSSRIGHQLGRGPANPMTKDELWAKFEDCAGRVLSQEQIVAAFDLLENFEALPAIADLTAAMVPENRREKVG